MIRNIGYYCRKVLPTVLDDALSYYEQLCKVLLKCNEVIDTVNDTIVNVNNIDTRVKENTDTLGELGTTVDGIKTRVDTLDSTVQENSETLKSLGGAVEGLRTDVEGLRTDVDAIDEETKRIAVLAENALPKNNTPSIVYATDSKGTQSYYPYSYSAIASNVPLRSANGNLTVPLTPGDLHHATSKQYVDNAVASVSNDYETAVITITGNKGENARLSVSELDGVVYGTPVNIYVSIDQSDIVAGPPPTTLYIGDTNLAYTNTPYLGIPFFDANCHQAVITIFNDGTNFITQATTSTTGMSSVVRGTFMNIGITDGTGGKTTLTVSYIRHKRSNTMAIATTIEEG